MKDQLMSEQIKEKERRINEENYNYKYTKISEIKIIDSSLC